VAGGIGWRLRAWALCLFLAATSVSAQGLVGDDAASEAPPQAAADEGGISEPRWLREGRSLLESDDDLYFERGGASWYGLGLHHRRTASGERFNMNAFTAAHRTLPFGTRVCVLNLVSGQEIEVRINDRGPHAPGRIIDLSRAAAQALGLLETGIKEVALSLPALTGRACGS